MTNIESKTTNSIPLISATRKTVKLSETKLVKTDLFQAKQPLPLVVQPVVEGLKLVDWAANNRQQIETWLWQHGGILFRNFDIREITEFEQLVSAISGELLDYSYRSTPRSQVGGKIYTSTEYPADRSIPLHNEMAYSRSWPMKIGFFCIKSAETGGETPIADSRKVFQRLDEKIKEQFIEKQVMYVRNYDTQFDLTWQNVFQTENKLEVENYCRKAGIEFEWKDNNYLRTRQVCQAVATHPKTGEKVWFNQAHLFHVSSLEQEISQILLSALPEEYLPRNAYYGDGSEIEKYVLDEIRELYQQEAVIFPWQDGDVLMLDNMLAAHGRMPFSGLRKVVVGMAEPFIAQ
ncbi:TauD/TfdA family dioxygenase [Kamptonema sp. UHCC 0994]|uniref:TauD/TfdA family dioxygenase n=1 Tax=Kamptonema sp. UHCC 0994 TaxID=3031329 RepID=UPI0023B9DAA4|nr:TauD/TfdA family dioxygenase [Kamptonema sp. UHCC 0994]MDF0552705.1 TauD/TfdA family dioxygenase [Kamptonema sp. UHCC 0994]